MWMETKLPLLLKKPRRRLEWRPPEATATTTTTPGIDDPNAVPSDPEQPKHQSFQRSNSKTFDVSDQYPSHSKLHKQWQEEMERLNSKYNLDCFF